MDSFTDCMCNVEEDLTGWETVLFYIEHTQNYSKQVITWRTLEALNNILRLCENTVYKEDFIKNIWRCFEFVIKQNEDEKIWSDFGAEWGQLCAKFLDCILQIHNKEGVLCALSDLFVKIHHTHYVWEKTADKILTLITKGNLTIDTIGKLLKSHIALIKSIGLFSVNAENFIEEHETLLDNVCKLLYTVGDYDCQVDILEILLTYTASRRGIYDREWFLDKDPKLNELYLSLSFKNFDQDARNFLNVLNRVMGIEQRVFSLQCYDCNFGGNLLQSPIDDGQLDGIWFDLNLNTEKLMIVCASSEDASKRLVVFICLKDVEYYSVHIHDAYCKIAITVRNLTNVSSQLPCETNMITAVAYVSHNSVDLIEQFLNVLKDCCYIKRYDSDAVSTSQPSSNRMTNDENINFIEDWKNKMGKSEGIIIKPRTFRISCSSSVIPFFANENLQYVENIIQENTVSSTEVTPRKISLTVVQENYSDKQDNNREINTTNVKKVKRHRRRRYDEKDETHEVLPTVPYNTRSKTAAMLLAESNYNPQNTEDKNRGKKIFVNKSKKLKDREVINFTTKNNQESKIDLALNQVSLVVEKNINTSPDHLVDDVNLENNDNSKLKERKDTQHGQLSYSSLKTKAEETEKERESEMGMIGNEIYKQKASHEISQSTNEKLSVLKTILTSKDISGQETAFSVFTGHSGTDFSEQLLLSSNNKLHNHVILNSRYDELPHSSGENHDQLCRDETRSNVLNRSPSPSHICREKISSLPLQEKMEMFSRGEASIVKLNELSHTQYETILNFNNEMPINKDDVNEPSSQKSNHLKESEDTESSSAKGNDENSMDNFLQLNNFNLQKRTVFTTKKNHKACIWKKVSHSALAIRDQICAQQVKNLSRNKNPKLISKEKLQMTHEDIAEKLETQENKINFKEQGITHSKTNLSAERISDPLTNLYDDSNTHLSIKEDGVQNLLKGACKDPQKNETKVYSQSKPKERKTNEHHMYVAYDKKNALNKKIQILPKQHLDDHDAHEISKVLKEGQKVNSNRKKISNGKLTIEQGHHVSEQKIKNSECEVLEMIEPAPVISKCKRRLFSTELHSSQLVIDSSPDSEKLFHPAQSNLKKQKFRKVSQNKKLKNASETSKTQLCQQKRHSNNSLDLYEFNETSFDCQNEKRSLHKTNANIAHDNVPYKNMQEVIPFLTNEGSETFLSTKEKKMKSETKKLGKCDTKSLKQNVSESRNAPLGKKIEHRNVKIKKNKNKENTEDISYQDKNTSRASLVPQVSETSYSLTKTNLKHEKDTSENKQYCKNIQISSQNVDDSATNIVTSTEENIVVMDDNRIESNLNSTDEKNLFNDTPLFHQIQRSERPQKTYERNKNFRLRNKKSDMTTRSPTSGSSFHAEDVYSVLFNGTKDSEEVVTRLKGKIKKEQDTRTEITTRSTISKKVTNVEFNEANISSKGTGNSDYNNMPLSFDTKKDLKDRQGTKRISPGKKYLKEQDKIEDIQDTTKIVKTKKRKRHDGLVEENVCPNGILNGETSSSMGSKVMKGISYSKYKAIFSNQDDVKNESEFIMNRYQHLTEKILRQRNDFFSEFLKKEDTIICNMTEVFKSQKKYPVKKVISSVTEMRDSLENFTLQLEKKKKEEMIRIKQFSKRLTKKLISVRHSQISQQVEKISNSVRKNRVQKIRLR